MEGKQEGIFAAIKVSALPVACNWPADGFLPERALTSPSHSRSGRWRF
jgi:hypothetical protein